MALIRRLYTIPSERRLCEEVRYNLAYRWFYCLPPGGALPHHSTFSENRHSRFRDADVFRLLFEATVRRCLAAGLVTAKDAAIDASFVAADASWQRKMRERDLADARDAASPVGARAWDCGPCGSYSCREARGGGRTFTSARSTWRCYSSGPACHPSWTIAYSPMSFAPA